MLVVSLNEQGTLQTRGRSKEEQKCPRDSSSSTSTWLLAVPTIRPHRFTFFVHSHGSHTFRDTVFTSHLSQSVIHILLSCLVNIEVHHYDCTVSLMSLRPGRRISAWWHLSGTLGTRGELRRCDASVVHRSVTTDISCHQKEHLSVWNSVVTTKLTGILFSPWVLYLVDCADSLCC